MSTSGWSNDFFDRLPDSERWFGKKYATLLWSFDVGAVLQLLCCSPSIIHSLGSSTQECNEDAQQTTNHSQVGLSAAKADPERWSSLCHGRSALRAVAWLVKHLSSGSMNTRHVVRSRSLLVFMRAFFI